MNLQPVFVRHFVKTFTHRIRKLRDMADITDDPVNSGVVEQ